MKRLLKKLITTILAGQVRRLRQKRDFKLIAIAGSIGKTSTKFAIAQVLGSKYRVRFQEGNYNVDVTVPLVFFDLPLPSLANPFAWARTLMNIEWQLMRPYPYDVVVVELSTDGPGQIAAFDAYITADIGVLTAIAPEHMEFFEGLDAVAKEELGIAGLSENLVINKDLCAPEYLPVTRPKLYTYGKETETDYQIRKAQLDHNGYTFAIAKNNQPFLEVSHPSVAIPQLYSLTAAATVADMMGMSTEEIKLGIEKVRPVSGRMQLLNGINNSTIIDDTYNASTEAVKAALTTLYNLPGSQKIAVIGSMNELGGYSASAHAEVGGFCDPDKLAMVLTLGKDANEHLAPVAEKHGCVVKQFNSPYDVGEYLKTVIEQEAVVLLKGSQNGVFAEEAIKSVLADPADVSKLVRQSKHWMRIKHAQFGKE